MAKKCSVVPCGADHESYVFVSYAHSDSDIVYPIMEAISAQGYELWYDQGISVSSIWTDEIAHAILGCKCFVIFVTKNAMESGYVRSEAEFALKNGRKVIPIYPEGMDVLPAGLALGLTATQGIEESNSFIIVETLSSALQYNGVWRSTDTKDRNQIKLKNYIGKHRKKTKWITVITVVVLMAAVVGGYYSLHSGQDAGYPTRKQETEIQLPAAVPAGTELPPTPTPPTIEDNAAVAPTQNLPLASTPGSSDASSIDNPAPAPLGTTPVVVETEPVAQPVQREAEQAAQQAQREAQQADQQAQREAQQAAQQAQREAEQAAREVQREAGQATQQTQREGGY
jgi:hypothetical protein